MSAGKILVVDDDTNLIEVVRMRRRSGVRPLQREGAPWIRRRPLLREEADHQRGPAVADEWQRDAHDRQDPADHPHVHKRVREHDHPDRRGQQAREHRRRVDRDGERAHDEREEEDDQHDVADQAELLGKHGEDEVAGE